MFGARTPVLIGRMHVAAKFEVQHRARALSTTLGKSWKKRCPSPFPVGQEDAPPRSQLHAFDLGALHLAGLAVVELRGAQVCVPGELLRLDDVAAVFLVACRWS
jgi:hypothetical protein